MKPALVAIACLTLAACQSESDCFDRMQGELSKVKTLESAKTSAKLVSLYINDGIDVCAMVLHEGKLYPKSAFGY
jgi:hypothetical protein